MRILIIDDFHELLLEGLNNLNLEYDYYPQIKETEIFKLRKDYQGVLVRSKIKVDKTFLNYFDQLKFVARGGSGMDGIDEDACKHLGIHLFNAPEGNRDAVAEQTVGMILAWYTQLIAANKSVQNGIWNRAEFRGSEIKNRTLGIIGFGNTGKEVARRFSSFGCQILSYDIDKSKYDESLAAPVTLEVLLRESDIISIHIPLLKRNYHLVNSHFISQIKSSSLLVNMSRGPILNTPEVLAALAQNKFAGLCLDVVEGERKKGFPILDIRSKNLLHELRDKIIMTPHIGGWTHESYRKIAEVILQKITNYLEMRVYEKKNTD